MKWLLFFYQKHVSATYLDACAACMMYTTVPAMLASSDSRVVRASACGAVDSVLIPSRVKPMTSKLVFTASVIDAQH